MTFLLFFIGGLISVVAGMIVGHFLNHYEISYVIQAALLVFIGMLGRSCTAWALQKYKIQLKGRKNYE